MTWPERAHRPTLLVNPYSRVVHRPECKHAVHAIPRGVYQSTRSDKPCAWCKPDLDSDTRPVVATCMQCGRELRPGDLMCCPQEPCS